MQLRIVDNAGGIGKKKEKRYNTRDQVLIRWEFSFEDVHEISEGNVKVGHLLHRGVNLPASWQTAVRAMRLRSVAQQAALDASDTLGIRQVSCTFLGAAKTLELPDPYDETVRVGSIVGVSAKHIACAYVIDGLWVLYPNDAMEEALFDKGLLEVKNVREIDVGGGQPPTKRLRLRCKTPPAMQGFGCHGGNPDETLQIHAHLAANLDDFAVLVAEAHWMAEDVKSQRDGLFDEDKAAMQIDGNPF